MRRFLWGLTLWGLAGFPCTAWAVVGQAERYNEFEEEKLKEFQQTLIQEETATQLKKLEAEKKVVEKGKEASMDDEVEKLRMELLTLPKRKRFQGETFGSYKYNSNNIRAPLQRAKGDSVFDARGTGVIDLSGKKTEFKLVTEGGKHWNWIKSENDEVFIAQSLNYRRKYFKKIHHSVQYRVGRHNSKTPEINGDKIRWDFGMNNSYNYPMSSKFSTNSTWTANKRLFRQEAFDEDSAWETSFAPSLFWHFTPKSRINLGYTFGVNRIRSKAGDTNSHELHGGYFGRLTRKSSASLDLSYGRQTARSRESPNSNKITAGIGYLWQWTAKTQLTVQLMRSLQNSSVELTSGEVDGVNTTSKTDVYFTHDILSFSANSRLTRKLDAKLTFNISHFQNKTEKRGSNENIRDLEDTETRQFTFPFEAGLTYRLHRSATLNVGYLFAYRQANEKQEKYRMHEVNTSLRLTV